MDFSKLRQCLEIIDASKPIRMMVHGKWHSYSHYEVTFVTTTVWFLEDTTGGRVPVNLNQIERWHAIEPSDELKAAIATLKEMK